MKKKILLIILILITFISVNNVHAYEYVNTDLYPNLIMPSGVQFYGWTSSSSYEALGTHCTDSSSSSQYCYTGSSGDAFYNDSNGFSIYFDLPESIPVNTKVGMDLIFCNTTSNNYYDGSRTYGIGTAVGSTVPDNLSPSSSYWYNAGAYNTDTLNFRSCRRFSIIFTASATATKFAYRIRSTSTVDFGLMAFMGFTYTNHGIDFSSNFQDIEDGIGDMVDQQEQTNEKLDELINTDSPPSDTPDDSQYDDYESAEGDLKDKVNQADLSNLSIGIDSSSSQWVWDTLTDLLQSHSAIFGMVIAILSIGIIKLALGR